MAMSNKMGTAKSVFSTVGSTVAAVMVARSIINDFLPREVHDFLSSTVRAFFNYRFSSDTTFIIDEFDGLESNQIFEAAEIYLGILANRTAGSSDGRRIKVSKPESEDAFRVTVDRNEEVMDEFNSIVFRWILQCHHVEVKNFYNPRDANSTLRSEVRSFSLTFPKKAKTLAMESYLPHVLRQAHARKQEEKTIKLHTVDMNHRFGRSGLWSSVSLNHPATFDTLAMDMDMKRMIMADLERFLERKDYYRRVGKAWKRGYLLYGPPGTGKSSLIAAMANYLKFDVYDLELSGLRSDSDLRRLLLSTGNRSILVVEDIDCSIQFKDRNSIEVEATTVAPTLPRGFHHTPQVTLSGVLNSIDGLWSSCGDERIIIFTTNHKEKLDPALLRPGRMDMHIYMSYCTPYGFNILATNYLGIKHHLLFENIERLIGELEVTPAEVAEELMKHDDNPGPALESLLHFLKSKKIENEEAMAKNYEEVKGENAMKLSKKIVDDLLLK